MIPKFSSILQNFPNFWGQTCDDTYNPSWWNCFGPIPLKKTCSMNRITEPHFLVFGDLYQKRKWFKKLNSKDMHQTLKKFRQWGVSHFLTKIPILPIILFFTFNVHLFLEKQKFFFVPSLPPTSTPPSIFPSSPLRRVLMFSFSFVAHPKNKIKMFFSKAKPSVWTSSPALIWFKKV